MIHTLGWAGLVFALAIIVTFGGRPASQRALEATLRMEAITASLANVKLIPLDTVREISQLLQKPDYDCNQLACNSTLETRNRVARDQLKFVLSAPGHSGEHTKIRPRTIGFSEATALPN
jgi:hypothetical protein